MKTYNFIEQAPFKRNKIIRGGLILALLLNLIYLTTGYSQNGVWTTKIDMPTARERLTSSVVNGRIYVIGGDDGSGNPLSVVEEYDPVTNSWTSKASMPTARGLLTSSVVNGKIYAIGGEDNLENELSTVEEYDPATDSWTTKTNMPTARDKITSSVVNGKIYVINDEAVEEYDPVTDTWTANLAPLPTPRDNLTSSVVGGKIYAIGGEDNLSNELSAVEEYDPVTDSWTTKTDMPTPRDNLTSSAVDGKIYAIDGDAVEEYDPATDIWTANLAPMPIPRGGLTSSAVGGKIYAIGGGDGLGVFSTVEEFIPPSPPVPVELASFTATVEENDVRLDWITATETNNFGFDIERTKYPDNEWRAIAFLRGNGTTTNPVHYEYYDQNLQPEIYEYRLKQIDLDGSFEHSASVTAVIGIPKTFSLQQNFPNPFNPSTTINYDLQENTRVVLKIYNLIGHEIRTLVHEQQSAGFKSVVWDGKDNHGQIVTTGIYVYQLQASDKRDKKKMLFLK